MRGMRATREGGTAWTVHGRRPARKAALASILALTAIALAGCPTSSATGSAGSTQVDGGAGAFDPGDGAASGLEVSIEPAAPTVCPGACVSLSAQAAGAAPPYTIAWSGVQGDGSTVQVCPAATTTYAVTMTAGAAGHGEVVSQEPTGSASVTVTVTPSCAGDGGTTDDAAAAGDLGQGHAICSQSWSGLSDVDDPYWTPTAGARMVAPDGAGNLYVAAIFLGTVNVAGQTFQSVAGYESLLVVKVDPACRVLWAKAFGASKAALQLGGIAADAAGNVVVAGSLSGAPVDFGTGPAAPGPTDQSGLIFKLGPNGQGLWTHVYQAPTLSGTYVSVIDVAIDSHDNTVFAASMVVPVSLAAPTPPPPVAPSVDFGGGAVGFTWSLVELDANGQFVFDADASSAGTNGPFGPKSLTTDSTGRIWAAGSPDSQAGSLAIVAFDASGHKQWVQSVSADGYGNAWQPMVRVDDNDEAFTAAGWSQLPAGGSWLDEPLLYRFSASGSPSWTPPAAIPQDAWGQLDQTSDAWWGAPWPGGRLALDPSGRALVSSAFVGSADFGSAGTLTSAGGFDSAVLRFDAQGRLIGGVRWGGADDDLPVDVAVDAAGDAVIAGWSKPPSSEVVDEVDGGSGAHYAIFVAKLGW
jgi:hypothetical protein